MQVKNLLIGKLISLTFTFKIIILTPDYLTDFSTQFCREP